MWDDWPSTLFFGTMYVMMTAAVIGFVIVLLRHLG